MPRLALALSSLLVAAAARAAEREIEVEPVTITATRISEDVAKVPGSVTVIRGQEMRDRGATDLRSALSLASGVDVAPGGDPGPAASIPEFWGLKEFDAFLLVVDDVPWGGAFDPALASLDLKDVERIEVMRGAAPVMYGATSFVGVVHVIHKDPAKTRRSLRAFTGSWGSRGGGATVPLPGWGKLEGVISGDMEKRGFRDAKTKYERDHARWRGRMETVAGLLKFDADANLLRSHPGSPNLVQGTGLSNIVPLDSNQNLADAYLNEDRYTASVGLDRPFSQGTWSSLVSYSHSATGILRGFWNPTAPAGFTAHGFRETIDVSGIYVDSHAQWEPKDGWKFVGGIDHVHGRGFARGGDFDYFVDPSGSAAPTGDRQPSQADVRITNQRDFSGFYGFAEWEPVERLVVEAGVRLNHTEEVRRTSNFDLLKTLTTGADERHVWRPSAAGGLTYRAWSRGRDLVNGYFSYKNTFKPSAVDFGLDTPAQILNPETAQSWEAGGKSRWLDDRFDFNAAVFQMDFRNQVVANTIGGNPTLSNSGTSRFRGLELESALYAREDLAWRWAYSLHEARYRDSIQDVGGVSTDVSGKWQALSARDMFSTGLTYAPKQGAVAHAQVNFVGRRWLDRINLARAPAYAVWSAGVGYRCGGWEIRLDGRNINDQRPPVSASEMGDSQVYLLPARAVELSTSWSF